MSSPASGVEFVKGHGTENDFVLIPDPDDRFEITPERARAICDRRTGIGADGVIRVAPAPDGRFFMDYRNADGSTAQMCGNGARLFARYLVDVGWQRAGRFEFVTRGGIRTATVDGPGDVAVEMGPVMLGRPSWADIDGARTLGRSADVGNPHLACLVDDPDTLDLTRPPDFDQVRFPDGVNLEFYAVQAVGQVRMRVFERGVGETRSCGTGTVAVAAVHLAAQARAAGEVSVQVRGGRVTVQLDGGTGRSGFAQAVLSGPTAFVATGVLEPSLWTPVVSARG